MTVALGAISCRQLIETNVFDAEDDDADVRKRLAKLKSKAVMLISTHLEGDALLLVQHERLIIECNPFPLWNRLKERYAAVTYLAKMDAIAAFHKVVLGPGGVDELVKALDKARADCQAVGIAVHDMHLKAKLLANLPESFRDFAYAQKDDSHEDDTYRQLAKVVLSYNKGKNPTENAEALFVKAPKCKKCKRNHHSKAICWGKMSDADYAKKLADFREKKRVKANVAVHDDEVTKDLDFHLLTARHTRMQCRGGWVADSGCGHHMTNEKIRPTEKSNCQITCANNQKLKALGIANVGDIGKVLVVPGLSHNLAAVGQLIDDGGPETTVVFKKDCVEVRIREQTVARGMRNKGIYIFPNDELLHFRSKHGLLACEDCNLTPVSDESLREAELWHQRGGHVGISGLAKVISTGAATGIPKSITKEVLEKLVSELICKACICGKSHQMPIYAHVHFRSSRCFELIHSDVMGPFRTKSRGGAKYLITFLDDYSRNVWVEFMIKKSEAFIKFKEFVLLHTTPVCKIAGVNFGCDVKGLRSDNGGEYVNRQMGQFCKDMGIKQELTEPYTPQQNGGAERMNRTLLEMAKCQLKHAGLGAEFWPHAFHNAAYIRNRCLTTGGDATRTPHELLTGEKPNLSNLRVFGCVCYVFLNKKKRQSKLSDNAIACKVLGYEDNGYRVLNCITNKVIATRNVVKFDEKNFDVGKEEIATAKLLIKDEVSSDIDRESALADNEAVDASIDDMLLPSVVNDVEPLSEVVELPPVVAVPEGIGVGVTEGDNPEVVVPEGEEPEEFPSDGINRDEGIKSPKKKVTSAASDIAKRNTRSMTREFHEGLQATASLNEKRTERLMSRELDEHLAYFASPNENNTGFVTRAWEDYMAFPAFYEMDETVPKTYEDAEQSEDWPEWRLAIESELESLHKYDTWDEVDPETLEKHEVEKMVGSRWIFALKRNSKGKVIRYKARLVAQGYSQVEGRDYGETYSPVASRTTLRIVMSLAAQMDLDLQQMDVSTAFLNAKLAEDEQMLMKTPTGVSKTGVVKLKRALYGLKQSPREWNSVMNAFLLGLGYKRCRMDPCLYVFNDAETKVFSFILLYVDDLVIGSNCNDHMQLVKRKLNSEYDMKDLGELDFCLGLTFTRDREARTITISQEQYIRDTLDDFGMADCKWKKTTGERNSQLRTSQSPTTEKEIEAMAKVPYREAIGRLLYITCCTRPDIAYAVGACARHMENPGMEHWNAVCRIMQYLKGSITKKLTLGNMIKNSEALGSSGYSLLDESNCKVDKSKVLLGFSDANHGACLDTRKSTSGYIFFFNGPISWSSRLQKRVAISPCEAEYVALSAAASESRWIAQLLDEISEDLCEDVVIFEDNNAAICLANNNKLTPGVKHVDIKEHVVQDYVRDGYLRIVHVGTAKMCADTLTKHLGANLAGEHTKTILG